MSYFQVADELTQSELVLGVGSGVGLCITVLLVVGLWVRHAKCGQRSEVMMMVILMFMVMAMLMMRVMIIDHDNDNDGNEDYHYDHYVNDNDDFSATTILPLVNSPVLGRGPRFSSASISALNNLQSILEIAIKK